MTTAAFERAGIWWLPEDPATTWHGRLYESDDFYLLTVTVGRDHQVLEPRSYERIHGQAVDGTLYTLQNCFDRRSSLGGSGLIEKTILCHRVFQGIHIPPTTQKPFRLARLSHPFLKSWLSRTGFSTDLSSETHGFRIEYVRPPQATLELSDGTQVTIAVWARPAYPAPFDTTTQLAELAEIVVEPREPQGLRYFDNLLTSLRTLLALATRKVTGWPSMHLEAAFNARTDPSGALRYPQVTVFGKQVFKLTEATPHPFLDMTFTAEDLGDGLQDCLKKWFECQGPLGPVLALFSSATAARGFLEERFLAATQALETFHRRTAQGEFMPAEEYDNGILPQMLAAIPSKVVGDHRSALERRLRYGNEYSLRRRLKDLLRLHGSAIELLFDAKASVADEIVDMRNSLTHLPPDVDFETINKDKLFFLTHLCLTLLELLLLGVLGFSQAQILELVRTREIYVRQAQFGQAIRDDV